MQENWIYGLVGVSASLIALPISRIARIYLESWLSQRRERARLEALGEPLRESPAVAERKLPSPLSGNAAGAPYYYLRELQIRNLRCFSTVDIAFRYPGDGGDAKIQNVNLLLGDNGSGKSTILKAAAMAALGPVLEGSGFVPFRLVRQDHQRASVVGALAFGAQLVLRTQLDPRSGRRRRACRARPPCRRR
jgi:hypothetical protein